MSLLLVPILSLFREFLDQGNQAIDKNGKTHTTVSISYIIEISKLIYQNILLLTCYLLIQLELLKKYK